jgi:type I restriction enzyme, S subunit
MTGKQLLDSILQEAIQGRLVPQDPNDELASVLLDNIRQEKAKLVEEGKIKKSSITDSTIYKTDEGRYYERIGKKEIDITDEIPFDIPQGWEWSRMNVVANLYTGDSINEEEKKSKYTNVLGKEYIGTKDISFDHIVDYKNGVSIPDKYILNFNIAPAESILLCIEGGSAGRKIAQINQSVCFGNKLCCFNFYDFAISKYVYYYLQSPSFFENFKENISGIIGGVSMNKLRTLLLPIPPLAEQKRIVEKIEEIEKLLG